MLGQDKPEEFCALNCRGFFHDVRRSALGLVFDYPQTASSFQSQKEPRSLQHLLTETSRYPKLHPTLDAKFWVAHKLCQSVLEFHTVGWLHKRLCSTNVLFFLTSARLEDSWFRIPYIVGFSHSRPDKISAFTGGPEESNTNHNQHPLYFSKRKYRAEYDYYSLGVVLLEIGLWAPLSSMIRKDQGSCEQIRQQLVDKRLPQLKQYMGRHYYEAVNTCLQGGLVGSNLSGRQQASDARALQLNFNVMVVQKISKLVQNL